ncbi:MAG: hypothetical protein DMG24_10715 [Acidobacteria bacterium]|nr:MAG: hypothetical protein DMG24_10715 [Acidobacteriota bacterium]
MPTPDDERFEHYLKQFRPLAPESLQSEKHGRAARRPFVFAAWAAAAATVLVVALLTMHPLHKPTHSADGTASLARDEQLANAQSLTIGSANALLAHAPSFKAAVDLVAFQRQAAQLPKGTHSALAVLSKEKNKL